MIDKGRLAGRDSEWYDLPAFAATAGIALDAVPYSGRVLLEALLRDGEPERAATLGERLAAGEPPEMEMPFRPARVLVQDYTGIPLLVDLAALRDRVSRPGRVAPALPVDVVVDHSVQTDWAGRPDALALNEALEWKRNQERYAFLKWAESAFDGLRVIPPGHGIVHQVNLERLATVVAPGPGGLLRPDTVIGTDSHTTMVNGLGVLGWGVGGLEAETLMLGLAQPIRVPRIVGVRLTGTIRPGVSPTDVALTLTRRLREEDVRGLMLEFTGPGVAALTAADRCTIANMAPEYGAMSAFFPVDEETLRYLRQTGRAENHVRLVAEYCRVQGLLADRSSEPRFGRVIDVDLSAVEASLAGPSRPDQRISLAELPGSLGASASRPPLTAQGLSDGDIVIASITSCTSTSNPKAMIAAGLLARRAVELGLTVPAHVRTSLSPGSRAVTRYLRDAGLLPYLEQLGFHVTGYGCMTCNGGSGPLADGIGATVEREGLTVCAVLSGNRNFEARVHAQVRAGYLTSPALVVALALQGHVRADPETDPLGTDDDGAPVYLRDLWPDSADVSALERKHVTPEVFAAEAADPARTDPADSWAALPAPDSDVFPWDETSTYIRPPAYASPATGPRPLAGARALLALGDDVSTDHISPVGAVPSGSAAGQYLRERGVRDFNSYGSRRGNHEVMARGTFSNPRLVNRLLGDGDGGGDTLHLPSGERLPVYEAAQRYAATGTPLVVLAGRSYGMGSSRDWAAKGPWLLGVRAVLAESFERIHRANLCAMGILPLLLPEGTSWRSLGLTGREEFDLAVDLVRETTVVEVRADAVTFGARADVHSAGEWAVLRAGGTMPYLIDRIEREERELTPAREEVR
ncbi:aconitate hydratase AcnA [Streptomyces triticiradicis]|uniref:Aconitate hydratase n=1 Tax=Streptomyces triticiradicis TaxID=2651189 RepID=A0A7J5D4W3_9ACTN|nr:aconitate hydratase AcnA [Streptomyces triticiradicis]KAB1979144.1 aconitate hydratase AcnA [Streptomyces triticiradicis]